MDSADKRTKRQKLQDMANQQASPREAEIAKKKLEDLGPDNVIHITFQFEQLNPDFFSKWSEFFYPTASGFGEY